MCVRVCVLGVAGCAWGAQGEPRWAAEMSLWALFSPLLLVQVLSLCSALLQLTEHLLLRYSADLGPPFSATVQEHDPFVFATKGMRYCAVQYKRLPRLRPSSVCGCAIGLLA